MDRIVVLTDLTAASKTAIQQAGVIASRAGAELVTLHIVTGRENDDSIQTQVEAQVREVLGDQAGFRVVLGKGDIMEAIPELVAEINPDLVVLCTHGIHGIAQNLFGAHVLKLVSHIDRTCLVVQENTHVRPEGIQRIMIPASPFDDYPEKISSAAALAKVFGSELVHYEIDKYLAGSEESIAENRQKGASFLAQHGLTLHNVLEDNTTMSIGFAQQTMKYAQQNGMDAVVTSADTHMQEMPMGKADKESFLTNDYGIPVLVSPR